MTWSSSLKTPIILLEYVLMLTVLVNCSKWLSKFSSFFLRKIFLNSFLSFAVSLYSYFSLPLEQLFLFMWVYLLGRLWEFLGPTTLQWNSTLTWFLDWNLEIPLLVLALLRLTPDLSMLRGILEKSMGNFWIISFLWSLKFPFFSSLFPWTVAGSIQVLLVMVFCPKSVSLSELMRTPCHLLLL